MQTRKRAKSITFGKKKAEKETVKKTEDEVSAVENEASSEKAAVVERRAIPDKPEQDVLSATPPKEEAESPQSNVETPENEFISDGSLASSPELPKDEKEKPSEAVEPQPTIPAADEGLSAPIETPAQPVATADQQGQQSESEELSSTLPPSAFTIQSNEQPTSAPAPAASAASESMPEDGKKRFGLYFIVVALLSFVLGLGAMATASYFGWVNGKLPTSIQLSALGQKPTPTVVPPTVTPTPKPVNLSAYSIAVLNGSGISGKAAEEKTALTTAGFKVTSTGNADKSDYTKTVIATKKTVDSAYVTKLENELKKTFDVDTTVATSPDSDAADVTVTLGSQTAK